MTSRFFHCHSLNPEVSDSGQEMYRVWSIRRATGHALFGLLSDVAIINGHVAEKEDRWEQSVFRLEKALGPPGHRLWRPSCPTDRIDRVTLPVSKHRRASLLDMTGM